MEEEVLYELGVDINSTFSFKDGDVQLISYDDNLVQSIQNKLNTNLNELDLFYEEYGSILSTFLGWKANDETLGFIKSELETILKSENRISSYEYTVEYQGDGKIRINLVLYPNMDYSIATTLEVNEESVVTVEEE